MKALTKRSNYDYFIRTDTSAYEGKWVAIADKKIVAHGDDAQAVYQKAKRKAGLSNISLAKIPDKHLMVLRFARP